MWWAQCPLTSVLFGLHDLPWSSLYFAVDGLSRLLHERFSRMGWPMPVERALFFSLTASSVNRTESFYGLQRSYLRRPEDAERRAHQPFQRKTPLFQVFGSSYRFELSAAGHTWCRREYCNCVGACEERFAPALYGMPPYLIDHYERLPWNVNLSTCMTQMPSWVLPTGMAVSLAMTGAVYPHPDSALSGSAVPPWGGAGMAMMLNADLTGRLWKYVVPVVWADDDVQEALLRGLWGSLVGSWSALVLVLHVLPSLCLTGSPLQFWIRLMYISSRPFLRTLVQLVAVLSFLTPATNAVYPQRIWLFLLGLAPFLLLVLRVSAFGRNANLAGGFAGRRGLVVFFVWFDSAFGGLLQVHGHSAMYLFRFYHFYFCQDRASGNIGRTGRKKKVWTAFASTCHKEGSVFWTLKK